MTRSDTLLSLAAAYLADGKDPFSDTFLVENQVTLDECFDMSETMAEALRAWIHMSTSERVVAILESTDSWPLSKQRTKDLVETGLHPLPAIAAEIRAL